MQVAGIVLAAGKGTRMKSDLPKVLHRVAGETMVGHVVRAMREAEVSRIVVVVGHGAHLVQEALGDTVEYALQTEQKGTGHAVMAAMPVLGEWAGPVLVSSGDTPLLTGEVLIRLRDRQTDGAQAVVATVERQDPTGYGRILWEGGRYAGIVEEKDATPDQRWLREVCVSVYAFDGAALAQALPRLSTQNTQGEYYLTDVPLLIAQEGGETVAERFKDEWPFAGVNDRAQLAEAAAQMRARINRKHLLNGVTIVDPATTYLSVDTDLAPDVTILPNTHLEGPCKVGTGAEIGPNSRIVASEIGAGAVVSMSVVTHSVVSDRAKVGPFAYLRANARVGPDAKIGAFVEVKNSEIGERASLGHLQYVGDASVGARTNIGAGVITANYDGFAKHRTTVGQDAFVGSNATLVAPVEIGDDAFVAAGSVITKNVAPHALAITRAEHQQREGWVTRYRARKAAERAAKLEEK